MRWGNQFSLQRKLQPLNCQHNTKPSSALNLMEGQTLLRVIPIPTANSEKSHTQRPNGKLHRSDLVLMAHFSHLSDQQISTRKKVRASTVSRKKTALPTASWVARKKPWMPDSIHSIPTREKRGFAGARRCLHVLFFWDRGDPFLRAPPPEDGSRHPLGSETDRRGSLRFGNGRGQTPKKH